VLRRKCTSVAFTTRPLGAGGDASVGSVGDAYDNAMAESQIGAYKTELICPDGSGTTSRTSRTSNWRP
jgi:hypothetical protein